MHESLSSLRARWAAVNAVQDEELRRLTADERFEHLLRLYELRTVVRPDPVTVEELAAVRRRWAELRRR